MNHQIKEQPTQLYESHSCIFVESTPFTKNERCSKSNNLRSSKSIFSFSKTCMFSKNLITKINVSIAKQGHVYIY